MATIRVFAEDDVPGAAALFARAYPEHRWRSQAAFQSYFREMLFNNPWRDPELPSWVAEEDGRISGFYAVMPRRMSLRGRPVRVAVGCQFMVDPPQARPSTSTKPQPHFHPMAVSSPAAVTSLLCGTALLSRSTTLRERPGHSWAVLTGSLSSALRFVRPTPCAQE
jgi:hypothetical protein